MMGPRFARFTPIALLVSVGFLLAGSPEDDAAANRAIAKPQRSRMTPPDPREEQPVKRVAMGERRLARGQYRYAARLFRAILDHHPEDNRAKAGLGRALSGIGRCSDAIGWLEQVRTTQAWGQETALAMGRCHERTGDYALARTDYEEALTFDREYLLAWYALAQLCLRMDRADEAFEIENLLLTFDEGLRMSSMLAVWRERDERGDAYAWEAWMDFSRLMDRSPGAPLTRVQADLAVGVLWLDAGDPLEAEAALHRAVAAQPQQVRPRVYRAEAWRRMGLPEQALYEISDPWVVGPDAPAAQPVRAKIFADLGRLDDARTELEGYPDPLDPELMEARWYIADKAGDGAARDAAAAAWTAAVSDPDRTLEVQRPFGATP